MAANRWRFPRQGRGCRTPPEIRDPNRNRAWKGSRLRLSKDAVRWYRTRFRFLGLELVRMHVLEGRFLLEIQRGPRRLECWCQALGSLFLVVTTEPGHFRLVWNSLKTEPTGKYRDLRLLRQKQRRPNQGRLLAASGETFVEETLLLQRARQSARLRDGFRQRMPRVSIGRTKR